MRYNCVFEQCDAIGCTMSLLLRKVSTEEELNQSICFFQFHVIWRSIFVATISHLKLKLGNIMLPYKTILKSHLSNTHWPTSLYSGCHIHIRDHHKLYHMVPVTRSLVLTWFYNMAPWHLLHPNLPSRYGVYLHIPVLWTHPPNSTPSWPSWDASWGHFMT